MSSMETCFSSLGGIQWLPLYWHQVRFSTCGLEQVMGASVNIVVNKKQNGWIFNLTIPLNLGLRHFFYPV